MGIRAQGHDGMRRNFAWRMGPDCGGEGCDGDGIPRPALNHSILYQLSMVYDLLKMKFLINSFSMPRNGKNRQIGFQSCGCLACCLRRLASAAPAQSNPVKPSQTKKNGLTQKTPIWAVSD